MVKYSKLLSYVVICALMVTFLPCNIQNVNAAPAAFESWTFQTVGGADWEYDLASEMGPDGSNALFMSKRHTIASTSVYGMVYTTVSVQTGKNYEYGYKAKLVGAERVFSRVDWGNAQTISASGKAFDWKSFNHKYTHSGTATSVVLRFIIENTAKEVYLDDVYFYELDSNGKRTGVNLITNPSFDVASKTSAALGEYFSLDEFEKVSSISPGLPVLKKESDINIDGNLSDWNSVWPKINLPYDASQKVILKSGESSDDLSAECKMTFDDEFFYLAANVKDDKKQYNTGSSYWDGDCVQITMGDIDDSYGSEFGFSVGEHKDGVLDVVSQEGLNIDNIVARYIEKSDGVDYEIAIPWNVFREGCPEKLKYCIAIADADGNGRKMCVEVAPGIVSGKISSKFPIMYLLDNDTKFAAWASGAEVVSAGKSTVLETYVLNFGEEGTFEISSNFMDAQEVTIPTKSGIRVSKKAVFNELGQNLSSISVSDGKSKSESDFRYNVVATKEVTQKIYDDIAEKLNTLKALRTECHTKGITTDYEDSDIRIIEVMNGYFLDDIRVTFYDNVGYKAETLYELCAKTEAALNAYLTGEKKSLEVPKYAGEKIEIDGMTYYSDMKTSNGVEKRPMYVFGYGHFEDAFCSNNILPEYGMNCVQVDIPSDEILRKINEPAAWSVNYAGSADADAIVEKDKNGESYLKIENRSTESSKYVTLRQIVILEPNTQYEFGLTSDCDSTNTSVTISLNLIDYPPSTNNVNATKVIGKNKSKGVFTSYNAEGRYALSMEIKGKGITKLDDVYVREAGSTKNILTNGSFDSYITPISKDADYGIDTVRMRDRLARIEEAHSNGCLSIVTLGLDYIPSFLYVKYPQHKKNYGSYVRINMHAEELREYYETYIKAVVSMLKDCKGIYHIYIINEPDFNSSIDKEYFAPLYHKWLRDKYGDISKLNEFYGTEYTIFDEIEMPNKLIENSLYFYDYSQFNKSIMYDIEEYMYNAAKTAAPEFAYSCKLTINNGYVERSDYLRRAEATFEDYGRVSDVFGCDAYSCYFKQDTEPINGKMMIYDLASDLTGLPVVNSEDHILTDGMSDMDKNVGIHISSDLWRGTFHNRTESDIWVYANTYSKNSYRWGCIGMRPDALSRASKVALDANRLSKEIEAVKSKEADISILFSEATRHYDVTFLNTVYNAYIAAQKNGLKVEFIGDYQLDKIDASKQKIMIIPNVSRLSAETLVRINDYAKNGGKIIIIGENALKYDHNNQMHNSDMIDTIYANALKIFPIESNEGSSIILKPRADDLASYLRIVADDINMTTVKVVDAETGEEIKTAEFEVGLYEGSVLINVCNYEWQERKVNIYYDGKKITSAQELRDNLELSETISLKGFEPVFLKFKF